MRISRDLPNYSVKICILGGIEIMAALSNKISGKIIPRNFGNIKHLTGSRLKDSGDTILEESIQPYFTEWLQFPKRGHKHSTQPGIFNVGTL